MICVLAMAIAACSQLGALEFDSTRVDLGHQKAAGTIEHAFPFRVIGAEPAFIEVVRASCGCLKPSLERSMYRPGETGVVSMAIHSASQAAGPKQFQITLRIRDPQTRIVQLVADADFDADISVQPSNLIVYVGSGAPIQQRITIRDRRTNPLVIREVVASNDRIQVRLSAQPVEHAASNVRHVDLEISGDFPEGESFEFAELRLQDRETPTVQIPIKIVRRPPIYAVPEFIAIDRTVLRDKPLVRQLHLRSQHGDPIRIRTASCEAVGIGCTWSESSDRLVRLRLTMDPTTMRLPIRTELVVLVSEPIAATVRIPVRIE